MKAPARWYQEWLKTNPNQYYRHRAKESNRNISLIVVLTVLGLLLLCASAFADSNTPEFISKEKAVHCLLGEARSEGYKGMLAVAEVLRRRGTTRGMYGCQAEISDEEMAYCTINGIVAQAHMAWIDSAHTNTTNGATHFEGNKFKTPYWAKSMDVVARIGDQTFYRERGVK